MEFEITVFVISCFAIYLFTSHPSVFINSISEPKFKAITFSYVNISFATASAV